MRIRCNDGKVRELIPMQHGLNPRQTPKPAKCHHCGFPFGAKPTNEIIEKFKEHLCEVK